MKFGILENTLKQSLEQLDIPYTLNIGEGAFYGPKLEFTLKDAIGREWQCGTIQVDLNLPERFDIHYIDENNQKQRPVMLHRALFGSFERFIGILIEHYVGHFPFGLHRFKSQFYQLQMHNMITPNKSKNRLKSMALGQH